jgi:acyl carrier protein
VSRTANEISNWLVERVGALTGVPADEVDPAAPLARHGIDSVAAITLIADLEKWLGYRFRDNPLDRYPTIAALSRFLAEQTADDGPGGGK